VRESVFGLLPLGIERESFPEIRMICGARVGLDKRDRRAISTRSSTRRDPSSLGDYVSVAFRLLDSPE